MLKKIIFFFFFIIFYLITHAQHEAWMIGKWKSRSGTITASGNSAAIQINDVSVESFTGIKTTKINNDSIIISISGGFTRAGLYLQDGKVVYKPGNLQWHDCSACTQADKMYISQDSLLLLSNIANCDNDCDGEIIYYRLLSEYDDDTQHYLVDRFGRPSDIIGFHPFHPEEDKVVATNDDSAAAVIKRQEDVRHQDSLNNLARLKQQQTDASARLAQQKKRQQGTTDSINIAKQKQQQRSKDSLANVSRLEKIRLQTQDSLRNVQAKKRQQEIADSINLVKQEEQQRIKDSLDNIARIRQQQINDSALLTQQKKRQQETVDSLNLLKQREEQRLKDSLDNVARLEQTRLRTEDSLRNVQVKKRQQEVADSLNEVLARKRQQEITDSLAALRKQQYNDSLQKAALAKAVPPAKNSALSAAGKELTSRTNVLLQTYHITSPDILIELFDNGEIDGDRVSVYHNNEMIVSNQTLGIKPITLNIHADAINREHEFVLVAENLGSIPPNSALMRITAGKDIYKLSVNTDMKTNAKIVFYYDGN